MITNYATLQDALAGWLARADLTARIPEFIQLAEARMNRDLHQSQQQTTLTGTVSSGQIQLPADCRAVQSVRVAVGTYYQEIGPLPPDRLADTVPTTGFPMGYVNVAGILNLIGGTGSPTFKLTYFQKVPALDSTNDTNWLLTREPGMYLYGSLIEASPYLQDDARTLVWAQQYTSILDGMAGEDDRLRYGNKPRMQPPMRFAP